MTGGFYFEKSSFLFVLEFVVLQKTRSQIVAVRRRHVLLLGDTSGSSDDVSRRRRRSIGDVMIGVRFLRESSCLHSL